MNFRDARLEKLFEILSLTTLIPIWISFASVLIFAGVVSLLMVPISVLAFAELGIGLLMLVSLLLWRRRALAVIDDIFRDE